MSSYMYIDMDRRIQIKSASRSSSHENELKTVQKMRPQNGTS